jgi:hypothetical protein
MRVKEGNMSPKSIVRVVVSAVLAVALLGISGAYAKAWVERFNAFAVDLGAPGRASSGQVEFVIERYSTDAERDRLLAVLKEKGPDKLLDALQSLPRVGYFRTPNSIGYDIKFARKNPGEDGGEVISLATDRHIGFWEATNRPRTIDYPFTVVEIHIGKDGKGEGKMSLATKVMWDKHNNTLVLENYKSQPVLLNEVKRESTSPRP